MPRLRVVPCVAQHRNGPSHLYEYETNVHAHLRWTERNEREEAVRLAYLKVESNKTIPDPRSTTLGAAGEP